jgi:hypothetical protein
MRGLSRNTALVVLVCVVVVGCARAARDTTGFEVVETATVDASLLDAWQAGKAVLREQGLNLYTRDTRGILVAYTEVERRLRVEPRRIRYTLTFEALSDTATEVRVEKVRQVYGVTVLTYPGWHDRQTTDSSDAAEILSAIQSKLG